MYPLWSKAGEIILLCVASEKLDDVPDPYYVEENGEWIRAPTPETWEPPRVYYRLIDVHGTPPTGLDSAVW